MKSGLFLLNILELVITKGYGVRATTFESQNAFVQITSDRRYKQTWSKAFCAFHTFLVEVQTNASYVHATHGNNNLEIRIAGSSCRPQTNFRILYVHNRGAISIMAYKGGSVQKGCLSRLQVYQWVGNSLVEVNEMVGKAIIWVLKRSFEKNVSKRRALIDSIIFLFKPYLKMTRDFLL